MALCCLMKGGNSPGSDPASVSMTTLKGPLSGSSWGFLSRVMSSLCFHKAFLESTQKINKGNVNDNKQKRLVLTRKLEISNTVIVLISWGSHILLLRAEKNMTEVERKEYKGVVYKIISWCRAYRGSTTGGSGVHSHPSSAQTGSHGEPCWRSCPSTSCYSGWCHGGPPKSVSPQRTEMGHPPSPPPPCCPKGRPQPSCSLSHSWMSTSETTDKSCSALTCWLKHLLMHFPH